MMEVESDNRKDRRGSSHSRWERVDQSNCRAVFALVVGLCALLFALIVQALDGPIERTFLSGFWRAVSPWLTGIGVVTFLICAAIVGWHLYQVKLAHEDRRVRSRLAQESYALTRQTSLLLKEARTNNDNVKISYGPDEQLKSIEIVRSALLLEQTRIQEQARIQEALAARYQLEIEREQREQRKQIAAPARPVAQLPQLQVEQPARSPLAVDPRIVAQRKLIESIHVPPFGEAFERGLIVPGQEKILICYELEVDEYTGELTGRLRPYKDELSNNCTMFLGGGSKSGKSTLMAWLGAQEALMGALFYVIDPHLGHPEKSIAVKLQALKHAFILPPAQSDEEIRRVLDHASHEADCRVHNIETPYSGRTIVVVIDEILNLFGRAQRNPDNKEIQDLYRDLAFFMRDLGTQYNKYDVNGIFATQYLTKDAFRLPKGLNVDFRDACQNQTLLRLPPNQAAVMRLLQREELREMRALRQGFGFMGFATGDIIRMASGNITKEDMEQIALLVPPAPRISKQFTGWGKETSARVVESDPSELGRAAGHGGTRLDERGERVEGQEREAQDIPANVTEVDFSGRQSGTSGFPKSGTSGPIEGVPAHPDTSQFVPQGDDKLLPADRFDDLFFWYGKAGSVRGALEKMGITNSRYVRHASFLLEQRGLKARRA